MVAHRRRLWLPEMEGAMARWYDRQRGTSAQLATYRQQAERLTRHLADGARVLEVAPGPGYLAIEIARLGTFQVSGLDISKTFVAIEHEHANQAGLAIDFRLGDVAAMPFGADSFDLIVCQAAFKNFRQPVAALDEMHRVLRTGGLAIIEDLRRDATREAIDEEVRRQHQSVISGLITRAILAQLRRRAYTAEQFERLAAASAFGAADVTTEGIGLEVRLTKTRRNT